MKRTALLFLLALLFVPAARADETRVNFDFFYETLAPYGEWIEVDTYGYVWRPANVAADWAPYTDGYWAYTDAGWTWVSYEDWGGITYHYGRWIALQELGWCWVPGYDWGPAWVTWRIADDYIGWAPLPPEAQWEPQTGIGVWVDTEYDIGPAAYRFCRVRDFSAPVLRTVLVPAPWNATFIERTRNVTNITWRGDQSCAFNGGVDLTWVSPLVSKPVPTLRLVRNTLNVTTPGPRGNVLLVGRSGETLYIGAPPTAPGAPASPAKPPRISRTVAAPDVTRGWTGPESDPVRARITAGFRQQIQGATPQSAPAQPFHLGLVKAVPSVDTPSRPRPGQSPPTPAPVDSQPGPPPIPPAPPAPRPVRTPIPEPPAAPPPPPPQPNRVQEAQMRAVELQRAAQATAARQQQEAAQRALELQRRQAAPPPPSPRSAGPVPPPPPPGRQPPPPQAVTPTPPPYPPIPPPPSRPGRP